MSTKEKPSTSFTIDDLQELAEAEQSVTENAVTVSEDELVSEEAVKTTEEYAALDSANSRQLRALAKVSTTFDMSADIDHRIFETFPLNESTPIRFSATCDEVRLFNAINSNSEAVADHLGEDLKVIDIVVTTAQVSTDFNDDFAEKEDKPCVHFFCENGTHYASVSNGIIKSTENLLLCRIIPSPESPIVIRCKEIKTKKGTAHTFDLISR